MKNLVSISLIYFIFFIISGCSTRQYNSQTKEKDIPKPTRVNLRDSEIVNKKLYQQYQQWKGTRFKLGGMSKKGIDCSGLIYLTYRDKFGIDLPRSTKLLTKVGKKINRQDLRAGDLVFFKTGFKKRHVGIYIEDNKFLHTSKKRGVMMSRLTDYYWKDRYWHSRRVLR